MNFSGISISFNNGEGARVVLWVSGCNHHCDSCQNPDSWDEKAGRLFTGHDLLAMVNRDLSRPTIDGFTLSGGDPMYPANRTRVCQIAEYVKKYSGKSIWMYTGYTFEEIRNEPVLDFLDVIVDGKYMKEIPGYKWCGSGNQRIWRKSQEGIWTYDNSNMDNCHL